MPTIRWGEGLLLRYGGFYGPGTAIGQAPDAPMAAPIRKRWFPIIGDGGGSGRTSTSMMLRRRPPQSTAASRVSTTSRRRVGAGASREAPRARRPSELGWQPRYANSADFRRTRRAVTDQHRLGRGQVLGPHPGRRAPQELIYRPTLHV